MRSSFLMLVVVAATGCAGPEVTQVTGRVVLDGEAMPELCVTFWPRHDLDLGIFACHATDEEGGFDISPDIKQGQGRAGSYSVRITQPPPITKPARRLPKVPLHYRDHRSPLLVDVAAGRTELEPFFLNSKP